MREIKFRAMTQPPNDFGYHHFKSKMVYGTGIFFDGTNHWLYAHDKSAMANAFETKIVKPETIGQFTGFHDSKGREIYEGDVLKWVAFGCPMDEYEELQRTYQLTVEWGCGGFDFPYNSETEHCYEIIGNIHESA
jgi:uncharacterized phage protein (TIGR01671 family)